MEQQFDYYAFISYKREDAKWAKWLQRKIESYRLPTTLCRKHPHLPKKLKRTFRDYTDIQLGELRSVLQTSLDASQYLIVICSPLSAKSRWVGEEIEYFIKLGRKKQVILFIIDGEPYSNDPEKECVHPVIKKHMSEMLGANINEKSGGWKYIRQEKAFIRVVSTMLNINFDALWQRHRRRKIKQAVITVACTLFILAFTAGVWQVNQPFDSVVSLVEQTPHNANLPFEAGFVSLIIENDTLMGKVNDYDGIVRFNNIAGKFRYRKIRLHFEMFGYRKTDTLLNLTNEIILPIERDNSWGVYFGQVIDEQGYSIPGAMVIVSGVECRTDDSGCFRIDIPLEKQVQKQKIEVRKEGFQRWEYEGAPSNIYPRKIMLEK